MDLQSDERGFIPSTPAPIIMDPPPASPSPRRGVRSYIREKYYHIVHSYSRSPSQPEQPEHTPLPKSSARTTISPPNQESGSNVTNLLRPSMGQLRHTRSDSQISPNPNLGAQQQARATAWTGLQAALEELHKCAATFPPLKTAIGSLLSVLDLLETTLKNRSEYEMIALEIKMLSESLTKYMNDSSSARMSNCIANVSLGIEQQAKMISEKLGRGIGGRLIEAKVGEGDVASHYRKIESLFRQLQTDANLSVWSITNETLANTRLEGLVPAKMANYDSRLSTEISRRACTEGTRTVILSEMDNWSLNPDAPDLYLMSGMAGTGKTTIACSFSNSLEKRKQLAASFFCTRTSPECRDAGRIISTIAYQLARYSIPFQCALCETLGRDPDIGSRNIIKQFEQLLEEPLVKVKSAVPENLIVVIDALDECDDRRYP
ncbi:NACHT domain containing protein [Ceratobasidium theobromae]|uniref:NACHT domain containing protein n=1 Tax=Ceratobasidium theobromae TaxID=1582974 RepID=A0A5N5QDC5_9AGAM|nr:NACHT domain containing protein [Ceratobasidium theobromae]